MHIDPGLFGADEAFVTQEIATVNAMGESVNLARDMGKFAPGPYCLHY